MSAKKPGDEVVKPDASRKPPPNPAPPPKSGPTLPPKIQAPQKGRLAAMSENDVNEYVAKLLGNEPPKFDGLELDIFTKFKNAAIENGRSSTRLNQLRAQIEALTVNVQKGQGQLDVLSALLISTEDARRMAAKKTPGQEPQGEGKQQ
jgi:hypothetical protein